MKRLVAMAFMLAGTALLAGCPKKHDVIEPPVAGTQVPGSGSSTNPNGDPSTNGSPLDGDSNGMSKGGDYGADSAGPLGHKIIYFDFDKSEIKPEFADIVTAHAKNLTAHPQFKVKLEGSTDQRGTREYNIGLGERRAQAVRRALLLQGVAESQVATVSFGSERPAADGDDESAWAQNRRVEVVYTP